MRDTNGARAATAEHPATPRVAPQFTRALAAERSRLEGKREQLLRKREAVQAELAEIDRCEAAVGELLGLLAPLLAANGSEPAAADDEGRAGAGAADQRRRGGETDGRDRAQRCRRDGGRHRTSSPTWPSGCS